MSGGQEQAPRGVAGGVNMVAKVEIVERLGESAVLFPALIEEGLWRLMTA